MIPRCYTVKSISEDTHDTFTLIVEPQETYNISFLPGQFSMLYLFGFGEIPISISGELSSKNELTYTIRSVGPVTEGLRKLQNGDVIGIRGPFGSAWPLTKQGGDIILLAGGLGMVPLRPALHHLVKHRNNYKSITLLYGTRTPSDFLYTKEMQAWESQGVGIHTSVDKADETWRGNVGVITSLISKHISDPSNTRVLLCGPEIMMKFSLIELARFAIPEDEIFLSMERNMKCAVGFCGHCQYGPHFLCKDGPIFSYNQVKKWLPIKEL